MIFYQSSDRFFKNNDVFSLERYSRKTELHFHDAPEFMYILDGTLEVSLNGTVFTVGKGDVVSINSTVLHSFKVLSRPLDYYILFANNNFFKSNGLYAENTFFEPLIRDAELERIFGEIIAEHELSDDFKNLATISKVISFFVYIIRHHRMRS